MIVNANDAKLIASLNRLIDLGVRRLASEHPSAFIPAVQHIVLLADHTTDTAKTVTVATTADTWVLQFSGVTSTFTPVIDGTWNGIYWIEVTDAKGAVHRRQCREFWKVVSIIGAPDVYYVSLDQPIVNFTGTGFKFRLHQPEFYATADMIRILEGALYVDGRNDLIALPRRSFLMNQRTDFRGGQNAQPQAFWRRRHFQMDAPTRKPEITVVSPQEGPTLWSPEPIGTFEYVFTYCWGYRNPENVGQGAQLVPLWESTPSPVSSVAVVPTVRSTVVITVPDIAWMVAFNTTGTLRQGHSGIYKRLYRRRSVTGTTGTLTSIEAPNVYQMMADIDDTVTSYTDNGSVIPDYYARLPESQGYYSWVPWPHPDKQYELDLYLEQTPRALANDQDAPRVQASHLPMLTELVAHFFARQDNDAAGARMHEEAYINAAKAYSAQQENPSSYVPAQPWGSTFRTRVRLPLVTTD